MSDILKKLYYDPKTGLQSKTKFKSWVRKLHPKITAKVIDEFLAKQELSQINKKETFKGFFKITAPPDSYQMDIFFMNAYKKQNRNISAFFIFIDIPSRKMHIYPLKDRKTESLLEVLKTFVKDIGRDIFMLQGDDEFSNAKIVEFCDSKNIIITTDVSAEEHVTKVNKLGIVDRATRTIKTYIRNYMLSKETTKFIDNLQDLVDNYNDTSHSSLNNKTPNEVYENPDYQEKMRRRDQEHNKDLSDKVDLDIGDYVRKRVDKKKFDKENARFSKEIFVIEDKEGTRYRLVDGDGKKSKRLFKYFELIKVNPKDVEGRLLTEEKERIEKEHKHKSKLRKEFGEDVDLNKSNRKKKVGKKAKVTEPSTRVDLFESSSN